MPSVFQMFPLILKQVVSKQTLERIPEPDTVTDDIENVIQYDRVMETKLAISYAIAIETIYRARPDPFGGRALDVCCGPGHLSINMARELKLDGLIGVDLSAGMVDVANANAIEQDMSNVRFQPGNATELGQFKDDSFDLTTMMDAAHHMPSIELVTESLKQLDRVTRADGTVVMMDLARLKTQQLTDRYVEVLGHDYVEKGLPNFLDDFRNSMFAAWTPDELASAVTELRSTKRSWRLIVPKGLPFAQFLIGKPDGTPILESRKALWSTKDAPVPKGDRGELKLAKMMTSSASIRSL